jgi:hypothetical protein
VNRLSKRLDRLESRRSTGLWNFDGTDLLRTARGKLSDEERALVNEALAFHGSGKLTELHQDSLDRWEKALREAADETGFPIQITADDLMICCGRLTI